MSIFNTISIILAMGFTGCIGACLVLIRLLKERGDKDGISGVWKAGLLAFMGAVVYFLLGTGVISIH